MPQLHEPGNVDKAISTNIRSGILFRHPSPHVTSVHAYFPSVVQCRSGKLLALYTVGEAFEAVNLRVQLSESVDAGETWNQLPSPAPIPTGQLTSESGRLSVAPDGELILLLVRHDRSARPDMGLAEPVNCGFVPMKFCIARSHDEGRTWSNPADIQPPLVGPAFEMCSPVAHLRDGRWLLPTSTWRGWDGALPNGNQMLAFISKDRGITWPEYSSVMRDPQDRLRFWESKIHECPNGQLLAIAWAYDESMGKDLPNQYAISADGGVNWSSPGSTMLQGQTLTSLVLPDGRILSTYRRVDKQGLWLNLAKIDGHRWVNLAEQPLWGHESVVTENAVSLAQRFQKLRFGAPSVTCLEAGELFVTFWCYEDCVSLIRWLKFNVELRATQGAAK